MKPVDALRPVWDLLILLLLLPVAAAAWLLSYAGRPTPGGPAEAPKPAASPKRNGLMM